MKLTETYMVHIVGEQTPIKLHSNKLSAELEAERISKKENKTVYVYKAISKFEIIDVNKQIYIEL